MDVWNRHRESENTKFTKLVQVRNFITYELKVFRHAERDTHTIFLCWLLLHRQLTTQPTCGARSAQSRLASPNSESQLSRSDAGTQLTAFSQIPKSSVHTYRHDVIHLPGLISYLGILFWHHIYQPLRSGKIWHKFNFWAEFNRFEFRVFLLLD